MIPVEAPREVDVREHALVLASATLTYSFEKLPGLRAMLVANTGTYLDRYVAQSAPGLLVLHGYGNVFERTLGEGETILVEPGGFLYKDSSVTMELTSVNFKGSGTGTTPPAAGPAEAGAAGAAAPEPAAQQGRFGRGLKGLMGAKSVLNVGALASAAGSLRSGGGLQGVASSLAGGGGSTLMRLKGPGGWASSRCSSSTRANEGPTVTDIAAPESTYTCPYCKQSSSGVPTSCPTCGAPVDIKLRTTASGWTELPSIADMARIQFGQSTCQVEGRLVPVAEMKLAAEDGVYFTHDVLLWQEPAVHLDAIAMTKPWARNRSGMPLVMMQAQGPGRIAFSHDSPGELVALPLQKGRGGRRPRARPAGGHVRRDLRLGRDGRVVRRRPRAERGPGGRGEAAENGPRAGRRHHR